MPLRIIAQPTAEPIDIATARLHLRLDDDGDSPAAHPDDPWLTGVGIPAAREYCEGWMNRAIAPQTFEYVLDEFPVGAILLPMAPITSLTSVKYVDGDGVLQTMSAALYDFDNYSEPPRIRLIANTSWPTVKFTTNAIKVRYVAGYDLPGDSPSVNPLPFAIKAAMLLVLGALYENREQMADAEKFELPLGVTNLLRPYQLRMSMA